MGIEPGKVEPGGPDPKPISDPLDNPNKEENEALKKSRDRILSEKKKLQAENDANKAKLLAFEDKEREEKQKQLESEGKYKEALELERKKTKDAEEKSDRLESSVSESRKLSAFLEAVNGTVDKKFWGLIDLSKIKTDENGEADKDSVNTAVATFTESFGNELIQSGKTANLPNNAPDDAKPITNAISYDDWLKLPPAEMKKRSKDVID